MKSFKLLIAPLGLLVLPILWSALPTSVMSQEALAPISPKFTPDPQVYSGRAGGDVSLRSLTDGNANGNCVGLAEQSPNHRLTVQKNFGFLSLQVSGDRNLSLMVKGPDGTYCRSGRNPEISGAWISGKYQIWIGTDNGEGANYRLSISETSQ